MRIHARKERDVVIIGFDSDHGTCFLPYLMRVMVWNFRSFCSNKYPSSKELMLHGDCHYTERCTEFQIGRLQRRTWIANLGVEHGI